MEVIYLAGPVTKPDPFTNVLRAIRVADDLMDKGFAVIIPHLSYFQQKYGEARDVGDYGKGYELWLKIDFEFIRRSDGLYRMSGFSLGADREVEFAKSINRPVFYTIKELLAFNFWGK